MIWDLMWPICQQMGTVTVADQLAFTKFCELEASFAENTKLKGTEAFDWRKERDLATGLRAYYELFGLSAPARARLVVKPQNQPVDKWAALAV